MFQQFISAIMSKFASQGIDTYDVYCNFKEHASNLDYNSFQKYVSDQSSTTSDSFKFSIEKKISLQRSINLDKKYPVPQIVTKKKKYHMSDTEKFVLKQNIIKAKNEAAERLALARSNIQHKRRLPKQFLAQMLADINNKY